MKPGDFFVSVRESVDGAKSNQSSWDFLTGYGRVGWNGLGRLTLADVAVGKTVYFLIENDEPREYRHGDSPVYSTYKMPSVMIIQEAAVFPASACAGLRD